MASWQNWSGVQSCQPRELLCPSSEDELADIVRRTGGEVRVVGASHSFSALVPTDDTIVSLARMTGIIATDSANHQATCWAGTPLKELGGPLWDAGLSLSVQGDVDHQTLGGAVGTGTHGTGQAFGCMSAFVVGFRLLLADGSFRDCDANQNQELFHAGRVSLGCLGIMTQIRLQCEPAFHLRQHVECMTRVQWTERYQQLLESHRHFEFFGFPHTDSVVAKRQDITSDSPTRPQSNLDNMFMWTFSESARFAPPLSRLLQRIAMRVAPAEDLVDRAHRVFPSDRRIRFNEVEYAIPVENFVTCFQELVDLVRSQRLNIAFPFECRWVCRDDIWLSPFYERDAAVISVHRYAKQPYRGFFDLVEPIFWKFGGRPHWGKMHSLVAEQLAELYPRWSDFLRLRQDVDPGGKFLNAHLRRLFGG